MHLELAGYLCYNLATLDLLQAGDVIELTDGIAFPRDQGAEAIPFLQSMVYY